MEKNLLQATIDKSSQNELKNSLEIFGALKSSSLLQFQSGSWSLPRPAGVPGIAIQFLDELPSGATQHQYTVKLAMLDTNQMPLNEVAAMYEHQQVTTGGIESTPQLEIGATDNGRTLVTARMLSFYAKNSVTKSLTAKVSGGSECKDVINMDLVTNLFRVILGKSPTDSDLDSIANCIATGQVTAADLEGATSLCTIPISSTIKGFRGRSDYDYKTEFISSAYLSYLHRLPTAAEAANSYYRSFFHSNPPSHSDVTNFISAFKSTNGLGYTATIYPDFVKPYFDILYRGRALTAAQNTQLQDAAASVANGDIYPTSLSSVLRGSTEYKASLKGPVWGVTKYLGSYGEKFSFAYRTLVGALPTNEKELAYSQLLALGQTDPTLTPVQWVTASIRNDLAYQEAGGCVKPAPRPQIAINVNTVNASWSKYEAETCQCLPPQPPPATGGVCKNDTDWGTAFKFVPYTFNNGTTSGTNCTISQYGIAPTTGGTCTGITCPAGTQAFRAFDPTPMISASTSYGAVVFGQRIASTFDGKAEDPSSLLQLSFTYGPYDAGDVPPAGRTVSGQVTGDLATNPASGNLPPSMNRISTFVAVRQCAHCPSLGPSLGVDLGQGDDYGSAVSDDPGVTTYKHRLDDIIIATPAPKIYLSGAVNQGLPLFIYQPDAFSRGSVMRQIRYPSKTDSTWNGGPAHSAYVSGGTNHPTYHMDAYVNPPIISVGSRTPPYYRNDIDLTLTYLGNTYTLREGNPDGSGTWGSDPFVQANATNTSPLVVDIGNTGVQLTTPSDGVMFDLLGEGRKARFSWVLNAESAAFLVLDATDRGNIANIDQLFGNNTKGPDGKTSANGFEALKKHDSNQDNLIDARDPVFQHLKLWNDKNRNGITEEGELSTLPQNGILAFDLKYEERVEINDGFGNDTRQRSIALMADGSFRRVFDIWFAAGAKRKQKG